MPSCKWGNESGDQLETSKAGMCLYLKVKAVIFLKKLPLRNAFLTE